jgi:hypothetical protein
LLTPSIFIVGLLNLLVIGLFYVFAFKRKVKFTTYSDKVVFNSNLFLMFISLHYLSAILLYISECIFNSLPFLPALLIPDLGALFFWALLIYVVKKMMLRRAIVKINVDSPLVTHKESTNFKVVALTLMPVIALAGYFLYPIIAAKLSSNIKIKTSCDEIYSIDEYSVNTERGEVIRIQKVFDEKKELAASRIDKLTDCTIVNTKNWACGGKNFYGSTGAIEKVIDGKFEYIPRSTEDKKLIPCKIEQLN